MWGHPRPRASGGPNSVVTRGARLAYSWFSLLRGLLEKDSRARRASNEGGLSGRQFGNGLLQLLRTCGVWEVEEREGGMIHAPPPLPPPPPPPRRAKDAVNDDDGVPSRNPDLGSEGGPGGGALSSGPPQRKGCCWGHHPCWAVLLAAWRCP